MSIFKKIIKKTKFYKHLLTIKYKIFILYRYYFNRYKSEKKYQHLNLSDKFKEVYNNKDWGDKSITSNTQEKLYFSGYGSYTIPAEEYINFISNYIKDNSINSVVDIGCGDFNIGKQITTKCPELHYLGIDIFENIIEYNNKNYSSDKINFKYIDTTKDMVPSGDLLLIREVLQHLSNSSISKIINLQFKFFKNIIITECYLPDNLLIDYNLDKPDGPGDRSEFGSGVFLDKEPFKLKINKILSCNHTFLGTIDSFEIIK